MVFNVYVGIGSLSLVVLELVLYLDGVLCKSSLLVKEIEVIKLVVSEQFGCDYCLVVYVFMGKKVGFFVQVIDGVCYDCFLGDDCLDVLVDFVCCLVVICGIVFVDVVECVWVVYSDVQIVDMLLVVIVIIFINLFNCVNDIVLDFLLVL